jgi:diguanylate cyclase (GGDEF)-like protein
VSFFLRWQRQQPTAVTLLSASSEQQQWILTLLPDGFEITTTATEARFGGDEFVVLLRDIDIDAKRSQQQTQLVAAKIAQELSRPFPLNDHIMHQGACSIGLVLFQGDNDSDELLRQADTAMYQAKRSGQNHPCWYNKT